MHAAYTEREISRAADDYAEFHRASRSVVSITRNCDAATGVVIGYRLSICDGENAETAGRDEIYGRFRE